MAVYKVELNNLPKMKARLAAGMPAAIASTVSEIKADAISATPVQSGKLRGGWDSMQTGNYAEVFNDVRYAGFVEYGTRNAEGTKMLRPAVHKALPKLIAKIKGLMG